MTRRNRRFGNLSVENYRLQKNRNVKYLGAAITERNEVTVDIRARVAAGNNAIQPWYQCSGIQISLGK